MDVDFVRVYRAASAADGEGGAVGVSDGAGDVDDNTDGVGDADGVGVSQFVASGPARAGWPTCLEHSHYLRV